MLKDVKLGGIPSKPLDITYENNWDIYSAPGSDLDLKDRGQSYVESVE